jgi:hypothetical protein
MTRSNGFLSLQILAGLISELRCKLNVVIIKFSGSTPSTTYSQLSEFERPENSSCIGQTAQLMLNYPMMGIELPKQVQKEHRKVLRDFSLL